MEAAEKLALEYLRRQPQTAARLLESLPAAESARILDAASGDTAATVVSNMLPDYALRCVENMPLAQMTDIIRRSTHQQGAILLRALDADERSKILEALDVRRATALMLLLRYPETAVGARMLPDVLTYSDQMTVSEAQKRLRRAGAVSHNRIFILDAEQHVIGAVSVAAVATANKSVRIAELAASAPAVLSARTSLVDAAQIEDWREFREIPVVNRDNKFVGVLEFAAIHTIIFRRSGQHGADLRGREPDVGVENLMQVFFAGTSGLWQLWADLFAGTPDTNWKSNEN